MTSFPNSLREWRQTRRLSQLDLALEAEVSARHISFLETGRARPSADMIARLGDALHLPLSARNQMLTLAGFATRYPARDWHDADMAPIRSAVAHMLEGHAPFPGLAVDRWWTILRMNRPAELLYGTIGVGEGDSLLDMMMNPALPQVVENWPEVAHHAAQRLRTESAALGGDDRLDRTARYLAEQGAQASVGANPVIPTVLNIAGMRLSLFATIAQFGTPEDAMLADVRIELYFPTDADSETWLRAQS